MNRNHNNVRGVLIEILLFRNTKINNHDNTNQTRPYPGTARM